MVTIVVGGQYGSEAKGKCVVQLALTKGCALAVRSGGPNAGHTVWVGKNQGFKHVTRQLPSALAVPGVPVAIAAGGMVDINLLYRELDALEGYGVTDIRDRLIIDPYASVVDDLAGSDEEGLGMGSMIGSTQTGTGITQSRRVMRTARIAKDSGLLRRWIRPVSDMVNQLVDNGRHVIIEGTQGFGLSNYHGNCYPYCTSRDTTASGFASEVGVSPRLVKDIWMVVRTWPIRVGGNSGPMRDEVAWKDVQEFAGIRHELVEMTSVTKKVRRVGRFDWDMLARAVMINRPTFLAVHGMDYLCADDQGQQTYIGLSMKSRQFINDLQITTGVRVGHIFTGPHQRDLIDMTTVGEQGNLFEQPVDEEGSEL